MKAVCLTVLLLAACSTSPRVPLPQGATQQRCIALDQVAGRRAASGNSLEFELSDGSIFRNQLDGRCPGLERLGATATVSVASGGEGGMLCRGDRVRIADPVEAQATGLRSYPNCILGDFTRLPD